MIVHHRFRRIPRFVNPCLLVLGLILMLVSVPTWLLFALLGLALTCIGIIGCIIK